MSYLDLFLKVHSISDVKKSIQGELNEFATDEATYCFGNGELFIYPADETKPEQVYVVDNARGFDELVRLHE